jgi:clan AA aspartic protease (TIGR02281 family)
MVAAMRALLVFLLFCSAAYSESIPLVRDQGTLQVPVVINGRVSLNFTIDSGSSDVSIPATIFSTLLRSGTVSAQDFLDKRVYKLADGSTRLSQRYRLRSLQVGNIVLRDVTAAVGTSGGALLLGQSFLSRLKSWSIDNERQALLVTESAPPSIVSQIKSTNHGGWVQLSAANDPAGQLLVNTASFQGKGNVRSLWEKHVYPPHTEKWMGKWVNYAVDHMAFDCGAERARLDARINYYEDGTRWVADSALLATTTWQRVAPDSWKTGEMNLVCQWRPQEIAQAKSSH